MYMIQSTYGGSPIGNTYWIEKGFQHYNIPCTTIYRMMNCVEVYNNIENNNPIYMSVTCQEGGHALLLSGLTINSDDSGIYRVVDSNRMAYVDIMVPANTMVSNSSTEGNFTYVASYGYTFTHWRRSHY